MEKRFQYLSKDGIAWTNWFTTTSSSTDPIQYQKGKLTLRNEYRN